MKEVEEWEEIEWISHILEVERFEGLISRRFFIFESEVFVLRFKGF